MGALMERLRQLLFRNFSLKLVALASAFFMWSAVANEPMSEVAHTVPVELQHIPADVAINSELVPQVQIWIRGKQRAVRDINPADLHATLDLATLNHQVGERTFELTPAQIRAPHGVEIVQVVPSQIHLSFDRPVARQVDVAPRLSGKAPDGSTAQISMQPRSVTIEGPQKRVEAVEAVLTDPV